MCVVKSTSSPYSQRQFAFCLHCRQLKSVSWFYEHKRKVRFEPSSGTVSIFHAMFKNYVKDIETEIELLYEMGRLFVGREQMDQDHSSVQIQEQLEFAAETDKRNPPDEQSRQISDNNPPAFLDTDEQPENLSVQSQRMVDSIRECFEVLFCGQIFQSEQIRCSFTNDF